MKQTAVEWFNQQLVDRQNGNNYGGNWDEIFQQAKEMEKQQIINSREVIFWGTPEEYYNETFKSE